MSSLVPDRVTAGRLRRAVVSDRETPRRWHPRRLQHPAAHRAGSTRQSGQVAAAGQASEPQPEASVAGLVTEPERSGDDVRRRGWFWHWNSIVTQYAPLIGLKGVGLLNSYTVWTDRREASPHRGYAFPSQQREADFYGEDRAELITINKILVALDLIEIRKEMVVRPDEQGRRWRVPHNFYRVKDHADGFSLTSRDVLKVVELAGRDKAVYRYIRRIFSPKFAPIDPANSWHQMLPELRANETWQRLAARAAREEDRASARSRAGHASRRGSLSVPSAGDTTTPNDTAIDSESDETDRGETTSVAIPNKGLAVAVDETNEGLTAATPTTVAGRNRARPTGVAPANTMYHQSDLTTTTDEIEQNEERTAPLPTPIVGASQRQTETLRQQAASAGPAGHAAPADVPAELLAQRAYEEANARAATPAERRLLRELATRFEPAARAATPAETGWTWVAAAIYEAVAAGSAFVAPRRLREILNRWARDGRPADDDEPVGRDGDAGQPDLPETGPRRPLQTGDVGLRLAAGPDIRLPHGFGSRQTWEFVVKLLASAIERRRLAELIDGTAITSYRDGAVTLTCPDAQQAARLGGEYRELIERKLSEAMRQPIQLRVTTQETAPVSAISAAVAVAPTAEDAAAASDEELLPVARSFVVAECGLPSGQVWAAVLQELRRSPEVSRANFESWLRTTQLLARDRATNALIVGVPHSLAQRRVSSRFLGPLRAAVALVIGTAVPINVVVTDDWLRHRQAQDPGASSTGRGG